MIFTIQLYGDENIIKVMNFLNIISLMKKLKFFILILLVSDEETPLTAVKNSKIQACGIV